VRGNLACHTPSPIQFHKKRVSRGNCLKWGITLGVMCIKVKDRSNTQQAYVYYMA
jgi:hypothetical protein